MFVDSRIQGVVLAAEETTVAQQVSHSPIKCQSRSWSQKRYEGQRNGSRHGDNPLLLLRPTGRSKSQQNPCQVQPTENIGNLSASRRDGFGYELQFLLSGV